ncbi:nad -binding [Fusarium sporotrichioides]|uniref:Nad-binding n=1 Tax=Fusarium sporotrichioides TaxID=5514 RepID=A0A395SIG3_FUSSP|nr:nad -binding [Fusarium sporotrichioides]
MHPLPQQDWQIQNSVAGTDSDRNSDEQIFGESNGGSGLTRAAWGLDFSMLFEIPQPGSVDMSALPQLDAAFLSTKDSSLDGHLWNSEQQSSFRNLPNSMGGAVSTIQLVTTVYGKSLASQLSPGLGAFVCADQKVVNYTGLCSTGATLATCLQDARESQCLLPDDDSLKLFIESGPDKDQIWISSSFDTSRLKVPQQDLAMECIEAYFSTINQLYPVVDEAEILGRFSSFYTSARSSLAVNDFAIFFLIVSIGRLSNRKAKDANVSELQATRDQEYDQARSMIHVCFETPSETSVQTTLLHIIYLLYLGKNGPAWIMCGHAIRAAQSLGLHIRFGNAITSRTFVTTKLDSIGRIDEALILWRDTLPITCRPDHPILVEPAKHLLVLFLHLEYYNLLRSVHWAALSLQPSLAGNISNPTSRIRGSEVLCIDAARSFLRALNSAGDLCRAKQLFLLSFQSGNCMAATMTIYRRISKDPTNLSSRADLEYLRAGIQQLGRIMPENESEPGLRQMFEEVLSSAQSLVWGNVTTQQ